ncbi:MAG TPA: carboxypeptidase-like regulatory domain-containing protein, partial [Terriglobales bacterium]|nr:carboxypeptidase-like regulatory domain-containing protein [Terriglobales bacterium]
MKPISRFVSAVLMLTLIWALPLLAQESIQYGSISGQVTDSTGALVKGAQVTARQTETNFTVTS